MRSSFLGALLCAIEALPLPFGGLLLTFGALFLGASLRTPSFTLGALFLGATLSCLAELFAMLRFALLLATLRLELLLGFATMLSLRVVLLLRFTASFAILRVALSLRLAASLLMLRVAAAVLWFPLVILRVSRDELLEVRLLAAGAVLVAVDLLDPLAGEFFCTLVEDAVLADLLDCPITSIGLTHIITMMRESAISASFFMTVICLG